MSPSQTPPDDPDTDDPGADDAGTDGGGAATPPAAPDSGPSIGPIDRHTLRPAVTLMTLQAATSALLAVLTIVLWLVLAPRVAAGFGLIGKTTATVTAVVSDQPVADDGTPEAQCGVTSVALRWDGGHTGTMTWCNSDADAHTLGPAPRVGDTVDVWTLGAWAPVRAGSHLIETVLAVVLLLVLIVTVAGSVVYTRHYRAMRAAGRRSVSVPRLTGRVDRLVVQRGVFKKEGRGRIRIDFDPLQAGVRYLPLMMVVPGSVDRSLLGAVVEVRPLGRTMRGGKPCGPYVLRVAATGQTRSGTLVTLGRAYRAGHG